MTKQKNAKKTTKEAGTGTLKKKQSTSPIALQPWLNQVYTLSREKINTEDYFTQAMKLMQRIPGVTLINLHVAIEKTQMVEIECSLFGLAQKDRIEGNYESQKKLYPLFLFQEKDNQEKQISFSWQESKLFEYFFLESPPFSIYAYQGGTKESQELSSVILNEKTVVFYQPLWSRDQFIGALVIAFEGASSLRVEILKYLQLCSFLCTRFFIENEVSNSHQIQKQNQDNTKRIEEDLHKTQELLTDSEENLKEKNEQYNKLIEKQKESEEQKQKQLFELEEDLKLNKNQIKNLSQSSQEQQQKIIELEKDLEKERNQASDLSQSSQEQQQKIIELEKDLEKERNQASDLSQSSQEQQQKIIELEKDLEKERSQASGLSQSSQEQQQKIIELEKDLEKERNQASGLSQNSQEQQQKIIELEKDLEKERSQASNLSQSSQEQQQKIIELEKDLEKERKQTSGLSQSSQEQQQKIIELEKTFSSKNEKLKTLEQIELKYLETIEINQELKAKLGYQEEENNKVRNDLQEKEKQFTSDLQESQRLLENQKILQEEAIANQDKEISFLKQQNKDYVETLKSEQESLKILQKKETHLEDTITNLEQQSQREYDSFMQEKKLLKENFERKLIQQKEDLKEELATLNQHKQHIEKLKEEKQVIKNENSLLVEYRAHLLQQIEAGEHKIKAKEKEITEREHTIQDIKELQINLKNTIRMQSKEMQTMHQETNHLQKEIGNYRSREAHLEKTLFSMNEEINTTNLKLTKTIRENKEQQEQIKEHQASQIELHKSIEEFRSKHEQWLIERNSFIQERKSFHNKLKPFSTILQDIGESHEIEEKVQHIRTHLFEAKASRIKRIFLYSYTKENNLHLEFSLDQQGRCFQIESLPFSLQQSAFGQVFTTMKPHILQDKSGFEYTQDIPVCLQQVIKEKMYPPKQEDEDTPNKTQKEESKIKAILLVPLIEGKKNAGLLTFSSYDFDLFDQASIQLLSHIAPLLAVCVRQKKVSTAIESFNMQIGNYRQVNHYLQNRYLAITKHVQDMKYNLQRELPTSIKTNVLEKLELPSEFIPSLSQTAEEEHLRFVKWVDFLGERAQEAIGLKFSQSINHEVAQKLSQHMGESFQNIYWLLSEAVTNVIHHSKATEMKVALTKENGNFRLSIQDNGDGIVRTSGTTKPVRGNGLKTIHSLAHTSGAEIQLARDEKGHGLTLLLHWTDRRQQSEAN